MILLVAILAQEVEPVPAEPRGGEPCSEIFATARAGAWRHGAFDAQTPAGRREIEPGLIGLGGLDLGGRFHQLLGWPSIDYASGDPLTLAAAGAHVGWRQRLGESPLWAGLSGGLLAGRLEVDVSGFGDFDAAVGLQGRGELSTLLGSTRLALWGDVRRLSFAYDEPTLSGDDEAFGATFAFGAAMTLRF